MPAREFTVKEGLCVFFMKMRVGCKPSFKSRLDLINFEVIISIPLTNDDAQPMSYLNLVEKVVKTYELIQIDVCAFS